MEAPMRKAKKLARAAVLVRKIAEFLVPVFTVINLVAELVNKAVNCNDRKLPIQISIAR
jgi:hypothetical protein